MDKISGMLNKIDTLPASPALLPKLARTLSDLSKTDVHEIVDIVMFDSGLTAKLLQLANSAFFGSSHPITTVGEAINILGYNTVFWLAAAISTENFMKTSTVTGLDATILWKHSVTTAFGAQHVAQASSVEGNLAFTAGLLHDVGKIILAETYGKNYTRMLDPAKRPGIPLIAWEMEHYGCHHADVGAALLENWRIPRVLIAGVKYHHHLSRGGQDAPLAACVCLGNALSHTFDKPEFVLDLTNPELEPAMKIVQLTPDDLAKQWKRIRKNWEFVETLCELRK